MTYFAFLAIFVGIPLAILSLVTIRDYRQGKWLPSALASWKPWVVILALCVVALVYTTPWDNYLVASGVWFYNPKLVAGIIIGYVPIEEYTFFVVLPIATGLWTLLLMRMMPLSPIRAGGTTGNRIRAWVTAVTVLVWIVSCVVFALTLTNDSWNGFTYLSLILAWALIPIIIQFAFGADILMRHWQVVVTAIVTSTVYLSLADSIAISAGTWTIDPQQSLPILLGGVLPIEEFVFFAIVNILVVIGLTLVLAEESHARLLSFEKYTFLRPLVNTFRNIVPTYTFIDSHVNEKGIES